MDINFADRHCVPCLTSIASPDLNSSAQTTEIISPTHIRTKTQHSPNRFLIICLSYTRCTGSEWHHQQNNATKSISAGKAASFDIEHHVGKNWQEMPPILNKQPDSVEDILAHRRILPSLNVAKHCYLSSLPIKQHPHRLRAILGHEGVDLFAFVGFEAMPDEVVDIEFAALK